MIYFLTTCNQTTHRPRRPHESEQAETAVENIRFQSSTRIRKSVGSNAREVIATRLRPHESRQAESAYFLSRFVWFYPDLCLKPLLESGFKTMQFQCPDSLVSCRKADSCKKVCGFKNIRIRVGAASIFASPRFRFCASCLDSPSTRIRYCGFQLPTTSWR